MDLVTVGVTLFALFLFYILINRRLSEKSKPPEELLQIVKMLSEGSQKDRELLLSTLQKNTQSLNERLDSAAKVIGDVQKNLGEMADTGRSMKELQEFLQSPKLRGNIGEQVLNELLTQLLPKQSFHLQYSFRSGEKVDAAIKTAAGIVPVDSKFPMENFRKMNSANGEEEKAKWEREFVRDVKRHIDAISKKYIVTEEGTIDYALMYVPSEPVYYEFVNNSKLFDYASEKRVLPVSPTTFYAYLKAILMSFEGQKIEAKAREILASLRAVHRDYAKVEENLAILQKHMTNAYNMMGNVHTSFNQLGQRINNTKSLGESVKEEKLLEE